MKNIANSIFSKYLFIAFLIVPLFFSACKTSKTVETKTAEDYFAEGMKLFKNEDYLEAQHIFDLIKLQYSASQFADDAQYYLSECFYQRKEYVMAAYNYGTLRKNYPQSEFAKRSMFKSAVCLYELSPTYDRDQEYTMKAIKEFSDFQASYPGDSLYEQATNYINILRDKLGHREFFTAELYRKMYSSGASLIYYESVINDYPDTKYFEPSCLGKIEVLVELKRKDDALSAVEVYKRLFPNGMNIDKVKSIEKDLKK